MSNLRLIHSLSNQYLEFILNPVFVHPFSTVNLPLSRVYLEIIHALFDIFLSFLR